MQYILPSETFMTAESNTKFMETAISQKIPFLGLIILIFTVITSTQLGVALMCYVLFFGIRGAVQAACHRKRQLPHVT